MRIDKLVSWAGENPDSHYDKMDLDIAAPRKGDVLAFALNKFEL